MSESHSNGERMRRIEVNLYVMSAFSFIGFILHERELHSPLSQKDTLSVTNIVNKIAVCYGLVIEGI